MKKTLLALSLVFLAAIILLACKDSIKDPKKHTVASTTCSPCDYHTGPPDGLIPHDLMHLLSAAYANDLNKSRVTEQQTKDALSLVFDFNKVKNFMWEIESSVCSANCESPKKLGLRFYYIKYDKAAIDASTDEVLKALVIGNEGKHSLAMVPVFFDPDSNAWYDFDYRRMANANGCDYPRIDASSKPGGIMYSTADNHGGFGPPPSPGVFPSFHPGQPD